jgi:hypothetical protein
MSSQVTMPQLLTAFPLALAICAICQSSGLVIPCMTCQRAQCDECFSKVLDEERSCHGCKMVEELGMDAPEEEKEEEPEPEPEPESVVGPVPPPPALQLHLEYHLPRSHIASRPIEYIEPGTILFHPILYAPQDQWKYAEDMLENYITFTTSSDGPSKPIPGFRYLVGRFTHSSRVALVTDYMLAYEADDHGVYGWTRYMSTYYNMSPLPYDANIFYPQPLPLGLN